MNRHWIVTLVFAVFMLGMFPNAAYAQSSPAAPGSGSAAPQAANNIELKLWHRPPRGLTAWDSAPDALKGDLDGKVELTYGWDVFHRLEESSGRQRYYDRSKFGANGEFRIPLTGNPDAPNSSGALYSLVFQGNYDYTSDTDGPHGESYPIKLLDFWKAGGRVGVNVRSSQAYTGGVSFTATGTTGAEYLENGEFEGVMWSNRFHGEVGLRAGNPGGMALGPTLGFSGSLLVGEHNSNWIDCEAWLGLRGVHPSFRFDLKFLGIAHDRDSNTVTGSYLKVEHELVSLGVELEMTFVDVFSFRVRYSRSLLSRFKVNSPTRDFSDETEQDSFEFGAALHF